jgi:hypothetical protein
MKPSDRARLTLALRDHVGKIAADLRAKMRAPGDIRIRAQQLHADEQVAEDFDVWTDLLSRRAAVLWVLKSVYVRVLEDRGLLTPGRLLDHEAQQLFERLAPHLGETAFLRWVYRDLASSRGGLPELFSPQPAEVALPSDELSRGLIAFWRHRDADTGSHWSFADEHFDGELMGDLYQELDPVVKDSFALCQTPDFVRAFILDRTLTPAIETFGAEVVRLLDPACGSGHFLIDGLKRLVAVNAAKHPDWEPGKVVAQALDRVVGVDLNDYACALARARLIMTAAELAGVTSLADAACFHPHVYWADGLEQVEHDELKPSLQFALFGKVDEKPRATLTRSDVRSVLKKVLATKFHSVVANPPYITEGDKARQAYHKEKIGGRQRYLSAREQYSLGAPFTERCIQLAVPHGFVGVIIANNFMKKRFGAVFVRDVLAQSDVHLVVDTSKAHIPHHGTPTVVVFLRHRPPQTDPIRVVVGKRGELGTPKDPAHAPVWLSLVAASVDRLHEDENAVTVLTARQQLAEHPWTLAGSDATNLKHRIESGRERLSAFVEIVGYASFAGLDQPFYQRFGVFTRLGYSRSLLRPLLTGAGVRDWSLSAAKEALSPYGPDASLLPYSGEVARPLHLWRYRTSLKQVGSFSGPREAEDPTWWGWMRWIPERYRIPYRLTYSSLATHNHFAIERGEHVFNNKAPIIKLRGDASEDDYLAILSVLNSSVACFWMKQVFQPRGATAANMNHPDPERFAHEIAGTGLRMLPVPDFGSYREEVVAIARRLDALARERSQWLSPSAWETKAVSLVALKAAFDHRWRQHDSIRQQMIYWQEELDWLFYFLFGLTATPLVAGGNEGRIPRGQRAFERVNGHRSFVRVRGRLLLATDAECETADAELPVELKSVTASREQEILANELIAPLEAYLYKRLWRDTEENIREDDYRKRLNTVQAEDWLLDRLERAAAKRTAMFTSQRLAADLMADATFAVVAEFYAGNASFTVDKIVADFLRDESVPSHPAHTYTESGLAKRAAWLHVWDQQRKQDAGEIVVGLTAPPEYSQGGRGGRSTDFLRNEYWQLRGKLDIPREHFIAFTEIPQAVGAETYYGWAGWTPLQRLKAILAIDEELEDASVPLADRIGLLDSGWSLLTEVAHEDALAAARLRAELQSLVGPQGPSPELIDNWKKRFRPPTVRATHGTRAARKGAESDHEETDES